jgi:hypothetical protein
MRVSASGLRQVCFLAKVSSFTDLRIDDILIQCDGFCALVDESALIYNHRLTDR